MHFDITNNFVCPQCTRQAVASATGTARVAALAAAGVGAAVVQATAKHMAETKLNSEMRVAAERKRAARLAQRPAPVQQSLSAMLGGGGKSAADGGGTASGAVSKPKKLLAFWKAAA